MFLPEFKKTGSVLLNAPTSTGILNFYFFDSKFLPKMSFSRKKNLAGAFWTMK
jgi:hypothetical protein